MTDVLITILGISVYVWPILGAIAGYAAGPAGRRWLSAGSGLFLGLAVSAVCLVIAALIS